MRKRISFLTFLLTLVTMVCAQPRVKVTGTVVDKDTGDPLIAATVRITSTDGVDETFGITNDKGTFSFNVARPGSFRAEFSYVGYKKLTKNLQLRPGDNALGKIKMTEEAIELKTAQVVGKNMRVKQESDTTVFNADGYKVMAGATGEDLLAKMPGMKISDGKIEAQGEEVKKVLVDGKAFFENDPTLALRTLPAEVIQSIAVFDKKSDQAELTGFDDGNSVKAIDVRTRSYKRNGVFGKVYGQYGTDDRYNVGGNVNFFNGDRRFTLMGLSNNVNQQNFSIDDILGSMGGGPGGGGPGGMRGGGGGRSFESMGSQSGITSANAIGTNYSDTWGDKVEVQASYFFNMTKNTLLDSLNRNYFDTIMGQRIYDQVSQSTSNNYSHRFNMRLTYKPNSNNEIRFTPNFNFQKYDSHSLDTTATTIDGLPQNTSSTDKRSNSNGYNLSADLVWFHKFQKSGRTTSFMFNGGATKNNSDSHSDITLNDVESEQRVDNNSTGYNFGGNVMYTEPLRDNRHQLSLSYSANYSNTQTDKATDSIMTDGGITPDRFQTSNYRSEYITQSASVGYRINSSKLRMMANLGVQYANLDGRREYPYYTSMSYKTSKDYVSLIPMLMLDFMPAKTKTLRLMYRANSSSPSISQLQQSIDNSNPLQLYTGNPNLDQTVEHSLSARYISSNVDKATNWMVNVSVSKKFDYIGSKVTYFNETANIDGVEAIAGSQLSEPVNLDGYISLRSGVTYGFPIDFLMSNLNISANVNYSQTPGKQCTYENGAYGDVLDLKTRSLSFVPDATLTSNISDKLDFTLSYNANFQQVTNNLRANTNYNYLTHNGRAKFSWIIWAGITMEHNLNWTCYTGSAMEKREQFWQWNASLGKKFLKNDRAELKLSAYDILKQNRAFSRTIADAYIQTRYSNVLSRYFMLTFTYNIQAFKKNATTKKRGASEVIGNDDINSSRAKKQGEEPEGGETPPPGGPEGPGGMMPPPF